MGERGREGEKEIQREREKLRDIERERKRKRERYREWEREAERDIERERKRKRERYRDIDGGKYEYGCERICACMCESKSRRVQFDAISTYSELHRR